MKVSPVGLDSVKVSPVIADLVAAEDDFSSRHEEAAPTLTEPDSIEGEAPPKKRRVGTRFSSEQIAILQREYDRGASRLSNKDIAMEIDMKPGARWRLWQKWRDCVLQIRK